MGTEEEGRKPIEVFPTWKNLKDLEDWIKRKKDYVSWPRGLVNEKDSKLNYSGPLSVPSFPAPFPTLPFSYRARRLKSFIPFQALPSKITVHDPWNLLAMGSTNMFGSSNTSAPGNADDWKTVEDKVHTYRLKILDEGMHEMYHRCETVTEQQEKCVDNLMLTLEGIWKSKNGDAGQFKVVWAKEDASDAKYYYKDARIQLVTGEMLFPPSFPDTSTISALASSPSKSDSDSVTVEPPIYLIHYPPPPSPSSTQYKIPPQANMSNIRPLGENTHLYFYPEKKAGEGHHSRAYKVEWEMPRTSLFPESEDEGRDGAQNTKEPEEDYVLCKDCIREDLERQLVEVLKTDGDTSESWQVPSGLLTRVEVVEEVKEEKVEEDVEAEDPIPVTTTTTGKTDGLQNNEATNVDKVSVVDDSPETVVVAEKEEPNTKPAQDDVKDDSNVTTTKTDEDEDSATLLDDSDWETVTVQPNSPDTPPSNIPPSDDDTVRSTAPSPESPVIVDLPETGISSPSSNVKKHYVYTYTGPLRPILITTKYQDRMRPTCKHLDPLAKFANPPIDDDCPEEPEEEPFEETKDEEKKDEDGATHPNDDNTSSSSPPQAPTSTPPKDPLPPTTKVRALAKLAYSSMYSPSCNHRGCSGSSSNHCDHLTKEAWCYEWFGVKDGGNVGMYTHWGPKPKTKTEAEEAREGEGEGEGNAQNAEGEERNEEKKQEDEDEGDIELGAIVPRYYGFWVHDENCPCEAPERTEEKVEEKEEEPKEEEVTVEQPQEQPQEQPPAQPQEQAQEQPQDQPQEQPPAQVQEAQDAQQQPNEVQPVREEDQQQVQDAQPQQPDEVQQTQVEDQPQVEEPQQQQQQDGVQEEQHQPQEEVPPLQEQEQVVAEQQQAQEEVQVPVERQEEETPQPEVQEQPQIPEEAEVEGHQEVQEATPRPEQQPAEGEGQQLVQEQVHEEAQGPQLNQEPAQEQIPSQAVQERQQEQDQVQPEPTQAPVQEDAKEEEANVVENVEAVIETRNENEGAVVNQNVIERADEEQKDEAAEEAKDDSGEAQEDEKGPEVVEGADRRPDDVAGENSQGVSDTAPAAGDGSDNTQAVVDDSNQATADANAATNAEVVEETTAAAANEEVEQEEEQKKDKGYFSDILLMENCGWPVDRIKLRDDEKETIQNLFRRFHNYGWVHYSPWKRNVVYHWGPINRPMEKRKTDKDNRKLSFRLIDFGRARHYRGWNEGGEREETWRSKVQSEEKDIREEFPV